MAPTVSSNVGRWQSRVVRGGLGFSHRSLSQTHSSICQMRHGRQTSGQTPLVRINIVMTAWYREVQAAPAGSASPHPGPSASLPSGLSPAKALRLQQKLGVPWTPLPSSSPTPTPVPLLLPRDLVLGHLPAMSTPPPRSSHPGHHPPWQTLWDETPRPGCAPSSTARRSPPCQTPPGPRPAPPASSM